jgi:ornithine cyclodeaminase/alanine dehydrogenase-like protein (mu-crystallin family)
MREIDEGTILKAIIVVDTYEGCLSEAGDLLIPIQEGKLKREAIRGDLGEIITGRKRGRRSPEEITLFESVGFAMEDVVVAHRAYEKANREGKGQRVEMF